MRKYLFAVLFGLFITPLFATGIDSDATSADCDNATLGQYNGTANLEMDWQPNTINVRWYSDDTQLSVPTNAQTCSYDGDLYLPSAPTKKGYTFEGWELKHAIPEEYTELQYIESSGTQWIDTRVSGFNSGDWEISAKWMITGWASQYGYVFGVYVNEQTNAYRVILQKTDNDGYYVSANSKAGGGSIPISNKPKNVIHTATVSNNSFVFDGQTYSAPTTGNTIPSTSTMLLFNSSSGLKTKSRIYFTWAKKDGVLKYNMIPAKRNSDGVVGMWDTVTQTFFTNAGSGTFTAGPAAQ